MAVSKRYNPNARYLVSATSFDAFLLRCTAYGLVITDCQFMPDFDDDERASILAGRHLKSLDQVVGHFNAAELQALYMGEFDLSPEQLYAARSLFETIANRKANTEVKMLKDLRSLYSERGVPTAQ